MEFFKSKSFNIFIKILLTVILSLGCCFSSFLLYFVLALHTYWTVTICLSILLLPLLIPLIWLKKRKKYLICYACYVLCFAILFGVQSGIRIYNDAITINTTPSINVYEYLPFKDDSKIVKIKSQTLDFSELEKADLPIIDGAAAVFPVYSAFVNATYPDSTKIYDGTFTYNNTVGGYQELAEKNTDIFIGASPSNEQIATANQLGTTFEYTQIGSEAFVFFVHKDNPIESLTVEQIKGIYSGKITNWSEVGGRNEEIVPFQRNEGSGSQSMLIRFMQDTPIMKPTTETLSDGMGAIIGQVAQYKNKTTSIGFSFRYYVEGIIKNPDIKMLAIGGISPTKENIKNGSYPIVTPVYAVTYKDNPNENVYKLIDWMLSSEGQFIIEESGYVGINKP